MKKNYVLFVFLFFVQSARSQVNSPVVAIIKAMPTTAFDLDNTITFGVEVPIKNGWSIQQDIGWGNAHLNAWSSERKMYPNKTNWRFRTQVRYYFHSFKNGQERWYVGAEYFHKNVFVNQLRNIGQQCNSQTGVCSYFEESQVRTHRSIAALHFKFGYQCPIDENWVIDSFVGFGVREATVTNNLDASNGFQNNFNGLFNFRSLNPSTYTMPSISLGFSIGYQITKKKLP